MMLKVGDLNLNHSVQVFGDSTMESLKQAMLQHEFIFRNQVRELHRLYWTQKNLMNEFRLKRFDSHVSCSSSFVVPIGSKDSVEKRNAFSVSSQAIEMWNSLSRNAGALEEFKGQSSTAMKNHEMDFNARLPADDFTRLNGKGPPFDRPGVSPINFTNGVFGEIKSENIIRHYSRKRKEVIDLEDSVELECHEPTVVVSSDGLQDPMLIHAGLIGAQTTVSCAQVSLLPPVIPLNEEDGVRLQDQKPSLSCMGLHASPMATSDDRPRKKRRAASSPMPFDLNVPLEHDEQSSSIPNNPSISRNFASSCENGVDSAPDSKLMHNTIKDRDDAKNSADMARACQIEEECREKPMEGSTDSSFRVFVRRNAASISSKNICKQEKEDADIKRQDSNITSSNSTNLQQTAVNMDLTAKPASHEGSEEETSSHEAQVLYVHSRKIELNSVERSADDSITTQLTCPQNEEHDATISTAAEILFRISSECPAIPIESNGAVDLPQHSSDSFERMTLQLSEVQSADRRSVIERSGVNEAEKNRRDPRLRRGRGFRDFQKEILPGLVTLSRHEICEDLHDIGYERRRIGSRNARDSWFVPVRSRRSNLPSGRRRR